MASRKCYALLREKKNASFTEQKILEQIPRLMEKTKLWYSARLLFESKVADSSAEELLEDSVRLIRAKSENEAMAKATALGTSEQVEYTNDSGELVQWKFLKVAEIQDLCEARIYDGMEVYSFMKWKASASKGKAMGKEAGKEGTQ